MSKTFGDFKAVASISFDIASGEIFCLLGHNGAGKRTTISCLTGMLTPDFRKVSTAHIYHEEILHTADGMDRLRATLGVCPQHDVLFPKLTLREHIYFFSRLKGKSIAAANRDADNLLEVFHLSDRAAHLGSELSGGQKRKLSTSIALAGSSKFVVFDEPTAGMDPVARRELWTLLRTIRKDRACILTTHYMDEADVLGDRVAIMVAGKIAANGTAPWLKNRFSPYRPAHYDDDNAWFYRLVAHGDKDAVDACVDTKLGKELVAPVAVPVDAARRDVPELLDGVAEILGLVQHGEEARHAQRQRLALGRPSRELPVLVPVRVDVEVELAGHDQEPEQAPERDALAPQHLQVRTRVADDIAHEEAQDVAARFQDLVRLRGRTLGRRGEEDLEAASGAEHEVVLRRAAHSVCSYRRWPRAELIAQPNWRHGGGEIRQSARSPETRVECPPRPAPSVGGSRRTGGGPLRVLRFRLM